MKTMLLAALMVLAIAAPSSAQWSHTTKTDIAGEVTEFATADGNGGISLTIRCAHTCAAFISAEDFIFEDQASVRIKFNNGPVKSFAVSRGENSDALFFSNPIALVKAVRDNGGYMTLEYSPYQRTPESTKFGVWELPSTILSRAADADKANKRNAKACAAASEAVPNELAYSDEWLAARAKEKKACGSVKAAN
jgi:hypothetical protein